jgi:hypothetical protein
MPSPLKTKRCMTPFDRQTNPSTLSKVFAIKEIGSLALIGLFNGSA